MMSSYSLVRCGVVATRRACIGNRRELSMLVPLEDEFPGLPSLTPQMAKATSASVTTLANGLTIVSEDACTISTVTLTFPKAGSSNEMVGEQGAAFLNHKMNFKSGSGMSTILINRTIEDEGCLPFSSVDRMGATVGFTVAPDRAIGLLPLLATKCNFEKWDFRDAVESAVVEAEVASQSAQIVLSEQLYAAAYGPQSSAGRSLYYTSASMDSVIAHRERGYALDGAVLTVTGVKDHLAFVTEVGSMVEETAVGSGSSPLPMSYRGGESRLSAPSSGFTHVALGFRAPSSSMMGTIVKKYLNLAGMDSGVSGFHSTGLIGVYSGAASSEGLIDSMIATLKKSVSPDMVKRAKNLAKAEALLALDGGSQALASAMTASVLESGTFVPGNIAKEYDAVSDSQVKEALTALLQSNPSLAAVGNIAAVPYHATIASSLS